MDNQTTVMIADNTEEFCSSLVTTLQRSEGFRIVGTANDGEQAVRMILEKQPQILVLDMMLAKKDREVEDIKELFVEKTDKLETVLKHVAKLLADNTNYTAVVSKPKYQHKKVKFTQLNRIADTQLLVIIVIEGNVYLSGIDNLAIGVE